MGDSFASVAISSALLRCISKVISHIYDQQRQDWEGYEDGPVMSKIPLFAEHGSTGHC